MAIFSISLSTCPSSLRSLIFGLDAPLLLKDTPPDPQIKVRRQFIADLPALAEQMGQPLPQLLSELVELGFDPASISSPQDLQLHLAILPPGARFPPHFHFIGHELYFGLNGVGMMHIGDPIQCGKTVLSRSDISDPASLSIHWSVERTKPMPPKTAFLVKSGEVHSLANESKEALFLAFICSVRHLDDAKDRVRLPIGV